MDEAAQEAAEDIEEEAGGKGGGKKGGKKSKKKGGGGLFGRGAKKGAAAQAKLEPKTALAYYGTIGGAFGTPRGTMGLALGQFNVPAWMTARPSGELIVSSVFAHEVQMLSPRGGPSCIITQTAKTNSVGQAGKLDNPQGIAVNDEGTVMWIANGGCDRIEKYEITTRKGGGCSAEAVDHSGQKGTKGVRVSQLAAACFTAYCLAPCCLLACVLSCVLAAFCGPLIMLCGMLLQALQ